MMETKIATFINFYPYVNGNMRGTNIVDGLSRYLLLIKICFGAHEIYQEKCLLHGLTGLPITILN